MEGEEANATISSRFVTTGGMQFEVETCGTGPRLALCLHGFPEHAVSWRHQLPMLAKAGYTAWAPNLRGYGNSTRPPFVEDYAIEHLLGDVAALIDASGYDEVVLIAHDWGAVIAWYFAMRRIRPLTKLIICNVPHPAAMNAALRGGVRQWLKSWYILFFQLPWLPEQVLGRNGAVAVREILTSSLCNPGNIDDETLEVFRRNAAAPGALTAMINYYRALVRGGGAQRQAALGFPVIDIPVLMIWGEADVALGVETTIGTDRFVTDLTLRLLPRVSHWVQQDAPGPVNAMIEAFLAGRPVPQMRWITELYQATVETPALAATAADAGQQIGEVD